MQLAQHVRQKAAGRRLRTPCIERNHEDLPRCARAPSGRWKHHAYSSATPAVARAAVYADSAAVGHDDIVHQREPQSDCVLGTRLPLEQVRKLVGRNAGTIIFDGDCDHPGSGLTTNSNGDVATGAAPRATTDVAERVAREGGDRPGHLFRIHRNRPYIGRCIDGERHIESTSFFLQRFEGGGGERGEVRNGYTEWNYSRRRGARYGCRRDRPGGDRRGRD